MGVWQNIFGLFRRHSPDAARGAESWQVGDVAECITKNPWFNPSTGLAPGPRETEILTVDGVEPGIHPYTRQPLCWLVFQRFAPRRYDSACFRKITPGADAIKAADADFVDQLRRLDVPALPTVSQGSAS